jgi:hypothetical protein
MGKIAVGAVQLRVERRSKGKELRMCFMDDLMLSSTSLMDVEVMITI